MIVIVRASCHRCVVGLSDIERTESMSAQDATNLIRFLSDVAHDAIMKDCLGRDEFSAFWGALLNLLSTTPLQVSSLFGACQTDQVGAITMQGLANH